MTRCRGTAPCSDVGPERARPGLWARGRLAAGFLQCPESFIHLFLIARRGGARKATTPAMFEAGRTAALIPTRILRRLPPGVTENLRERSVPGRSRGFFAVAVGVP